MAEFIISLNPATGKAIGKIKSSTRADVKGAVASARLAQPKWQALPYSKRAACMKKVAAYLRKNRRRLAELLHREQGKPMEEAKGEAFRLAERIEFYIRNTARYVKSERIGKARGCTVLHEPRGVVAVISPWNFPLSNPLLSICPALLSGSTVILKPSEVTPLCGAALGKAFRAGRFPKGVFAVLNGRGDIGAEIVDSGIDMVSFTGSVATGKRIMESSAKWLHFLTLELGGKDPAIVLPDADVEKAAEGIVAEAVYNTGQVCSSVERVYVHEKIYGRFLRFAAAKTKALRPGTDYGPLVSEEQRRIVESHVKDAVKKGAKVLCGGARVKGSGFWYLPTVLVDVNHGMKVMRDETFGPVIPIMKFRRENEALRLANDSRYGLGASIWSRSRAKAEQLAGLIKAGTVWVNCHSVVNNLCPWGGVKESGLGRVRGREGILEFTASKALFLY